MGYQKNNEYSDSAKVGINELSDSFFHYKIQNFPESSLSHVRVIQINQLISESSDSQIADFVSKCLHELECRILGEHIANGNKEYKKTKLEELKQLLNR